jgi:hypothetical protein
MTPDARRSRKALIPLEPSRANHPEALRGCCLVACAAPAISSRPGVMRLKRSSTEAVPEKGRSPAAVSAVSVPMASGACQPKTSTPPEGGW